jgi:hypothetical protein
MFVFTENHERSKRKTQSEEQYSFLLVTESDSSQNCFWAVIKHEDNTIRYVYQLSPKKSHKYQTTPPPKKKKNFIIPSQIFGYTKD